MLSDFMGDFTLKLLIGERVAETVWHIGVLYWGIIVLYFGYLTYQHMQGHPACHSKRCAHAHREEEKRQ